VLLRQGADHLTRPRGRSQVLDPEDRDPAEDDDVWLGHVLLRPGLWSPDRCRSGVADGCGRARRGTRRQGGRGLSLATRLKRRANGFLGTERVFAGCGFTKVARHTVRGMVMLAGPKGADTDNGRSLRPLGRATTGHSCRSRALLVRCSAVGPTKTKRPPLLGGGRLPPTWGAGTTRGREPRYAGSPLGTGRVQTRR
jgi:hypothetical protein